MAGSATASTAGYNRSDTYSRSRTLTERHLAAAGVRGRRPTSRCRSPLERAAAGRPDHRPRHRRAPAATATRCRTSTAAARLDYYLDNGAVLSADGGAAKVENEVFVTGIGRVQVLKAIKPYARAALAPTATTSSGTGTAGPRWIRSSRSSRVCRWRSGRTSSTSRARTTGTSSRTAGRVVYGASYRNTKVNTSGTLMNPVNDDRSDDLLLRLRPGGVQDHSAAPARGRGAGRRRRPVRDPVLSQGRPGLQPQREPLVPVLGQPRVPDPELLRVLPPGAGGGAERRTRHARERDPDLLRRRSRRAPLPPGALAGLNHHRDLPWNFSARPRRSRSATPIWRSRRCSAGSWAIREASASRLYVTADLYINELQNFVTDLLPGVNPDYPTFALTDDG